jgi:hypothetical protein
MQMSKQRKGQSETCRTPATQIQMRRAQRILSRIKNNLRRAPILSPDSLAPVILSAAPTTPASLSLALNDKEVNFCSHQRTDKAHRTVSEVLEVRFPEHESMNILADQHQHDLQKDRGASLQTGQTATRLSDG